MTDPTGFEGTEQNSSGGKDQDADKKKEEVIQEIHVTAHRLGATGTITISKFGVAGSERKAEFHRGIARDLRSMVADASKKDFWSRPDQLIAEWNEAAELEDTIADGLEGKVNETKMAFWFAGAILKGIAKKRGMKSGGPDTRALNAKSKTYQTYTKTNPKTGEVYCGRTSGCGSPEQNVADRDSNHHMTEKGFGPSVLDKSSSNSDAIRGREQQVIEANGGSKRSGGTSGNEINGVGPNNSNREKYMEAATKEFQ